MNCDPHTAKLAIAKVILLGWLVLDDWRQALSHCEGWSAMKCAVCHRRLTKPAALSKGLPVGPICAARLGLTVPKAKRLSGVAREADVLVVDGQIGLFEGDSL